MAGWNKDRGKRLLYRWKTDYDFKTVSAAFGSLLVTVFFALYNGFLGIYHASLWYGTICFYYILLSILRGTVIASEKRIASFDDKQKARNKVYLSSTVLLLALNMSLIMPISLMVRQQKPVSMTLIPAITMAAYTTYKITMASVHLKRSKDSTDCLVGLLRTINFIDALVSILVLQNTLIMVKMRGDGMTMLPLTAATSAAALIAILLVSAFALARGVIRMKQKG